jgi:CheY-like chemotaxis protein
MIDQTGCFITSVSSGIECMDEISRDKYDLILLARNMPRMDGIQTLNNMKNSPMNKSKDAKVYVILGEKVDEPDIFFENAGFDGIIRKPIDRTILQNIIISLVPSKMLPDDEELLEEIKKDAEDAEVLKGCGVRLLEALKNFGGDIDAYKEAASKFCDDYEIVSSDMIDALFSGKNTDYMNFSRDMRESSRKIGAAYLADCFDDHVNMSKDDSLDVAESNWHSLVNEWENVVSGLAGWLGKTSIQLGSTEVLTSDTNGIRLSDQDIKNRIEEILINLENNEQELAHKNLSRLFEYELPHDLRHKIDRVSRAFDQDRINTAVDILRSI